MMQRAEAGIPNAAASVIRAAVNCVRELSMGKSYLRLTDIAPDWCLVQGVVGPYDGIYKLVEAG